tara:strand:+ start:612 stop:863 length:252 start_codon:yes stop_codon:yes gene_type:complete
MTYQITECLSKFKFWGEAKVLADKLTYTELVLLDAEFTEYFDGATVTDFDINNFFWFDSDMVCKWLGVEEDDVLDRLSIYNPL